VSSTADGCSIEVGEHVLVADEVLGVRRDLIVQPAGPVFASVAPDGCAGLATCEDRPVVVIDPDNPPAVLMAADVQTAEAEENDDGF
jgi:hypothetical protein